MQHDACKRVRAGEAFDLDFVRSLIRIKKGLATTDEARLHSARGRGAAAGGGRFPRQTAAWARTGQHTSLPATPAEQTVTEHVFRWIMPGNRNDVFWNGLPVNPIRVLRNISQGKN